MPIYFVIQMYNVWERDYTFHNAIHQPYTLVVRHNHSWRAILNCAERYRSAAYTTDRATQWLSICVSPPVTTPRRSLRCTSLSHCSRRRRCVELREQDLVPLLRLTCVCQHLFTHLNTVVFLRAIIFEQTCHTSSDMVISSSFTVLFFTLSVFSRLFITIQTHTSRWCQKVDFSICTLRPTRTGCIGYKTLSWLPSSYVAVNSPSVLLKICLLVFVKNTYNFTRPPSPDPAVYFNTKPLRRTRTGCVRYIFVSWFLRAYVAKHPHTAPLERYLIFFVTTTSCCTRPPSQDLCTLRCYRPSPYYSHSHLFRTFPSIFCPPKLRTSVAHT